MATQSFFHRTSCQVATVAIALSTVFSHFGRFAVAAQSESEDRSFLIDQSNSGDPIKIVGFNVNDSTFTPVPDFKTENGVIFPGVSVQASDEAWLKNSSIEIQNVNRKKVDGVWITITFAESSVVNYIQLGSAKRRLRTSADTNPSPDKSAFTLNQGQTLKVPLGADYEATKSVRDKQNPNGTRVAKVRIEMVFFLDGTAWTQGSFLRPDPNKPGKFIRVCPSEFYAYKVGN
jgi:hypothetical protein